MLKALLSFMMLLCGLMGLQTESVKETTNDVQGRVIAAFSKLVDSEHDWRAAQTAVDELEEIGEPALETVMQGAEHHENARVRLTCYRLLTSAFAKSERVLEFIANNGLADADSQIRYVSAFSLGERRFFPAHRRLRLAMEREDASDWELYAAAKSLAELGEADVLLVLYEAIESDWYMHRYMGNLGLKGLTGKDLNDFDRYDFSEGAFVSGGREAVPAFDAIAQSERRAKRYGAMTAYFKWLKTERPEVYKHVEPTK